MIYRLLTISLLLNALSAHSCPLQKLTYITEDYPPHNFRENGILKGVSVDLLLEALKAINCPIERTSIQVLPWTRGYTMIQSQSDVVLFGTSRLEEREKLFKWAGPYITTSITLIAKKDSQIKIRNPTDIKNYTIGVVKDDVGEKLIKSIGVSQTQIKYGNNEPETLARMLAADRFDLWSAEINGTKWLLTKLGYDIQQFEVVYTFNSVPAFYAFSKNVPDTTVALLQKGIDIATNTELPSGHTLLDEIYTKYGLKKLNHPK
ncbi:substrate-binding periplasmic protein [Spartinivicinus ruber]|uniref:substrate-binding periplasmic protein n=1 Tax=Spartinivicinus ruber TaxID=2683272 RepID=UPI0013D4463F|nr:transporter substrate-binding domain-containing protein [Spartinivicinus ruber]